MLVANWYPQANRRRTQVETSKLYWCRLPVDEHIDTISRSASTAYSIAVYGALRCIAGRPFGHLDGLDSLANAKLDGLDLLAALSGTITTFPVPTHLLPLWAQICNGVLSLSLRYGL